MAKADPEAVGGGLRIALVTAEFDGPTRNGGVGTAFRELAETLREGGHSVSVLFAGPFHHGDGEYWSRTLGIEGIEFCALSAAEAADYHGRWRAVSADVCRWLKRRSFDVVHFHEWLGYGLKTVLAKAGGEAFASTVLCTTLHSPTQWIDAGNEETASAEKGEISRAEQFCVEHADVVLSPSRYMLEHVLSRGWKVPGSPLVMQNILTARQEHRPANPPAIITELVFFGRLEKRKGLDIFCDAVDLLPSTVGEVRLTFLGRENVIDGRNASEYIGARAANWNRSWRIVSDMPRARALDFLQVPGRLAVMPSRAENCSYAVLECMGRGIPFLASRVGGTPELIRKKRRSQALFDNSPEALSRALGKALAGGAAAVPPEVPFEETRKSWLKWHAPANVQPLADRWSRPRPVPEGSPLVLYTTLFDCSPGQPFCAMLVLSVLSLRRFHPDVGYLVLDYSQSVEVDGILSRWRRELGLTVRKYHFEERLRSRRWRTIMGLRWDGLLRYLDEGSLWTRFVHIDVDTIFSGPFLHFAEGVFDFRFIDYSMIAGKPLALADWFCVLNTESRKTRRLLALARSLNQEPYVWDHFGDLSSKNYPDSEACMEIAIGLLGRDGYSPLSTDDLPAVEHYAHHNAGRYAEILAHAEEVLEETGCRRRFVEDFGEPEQIIYRKLG